MIKNPLQSEKHAVLQATGKTFAKLIGDSDIFTNIYAQLEHLTNDVHVLAERIRYLEEEANYVECDLDSTERDYDEAKGEKNVKS